MGSNLTNENGPHVVFVHVISPRASYVISLAWSCFVNFFSAICFCWQQRSWDHSIGKNSQVRRKYYYLIENRIEGKQVGSPERVMENLIKLTVKTPNQRIDDIQIDCDLQWTVRKLKDYLQDVYPSNPVSIFMWYDPSRRIL